MRKYLQKKYLIEAGIYAVIFIVAVGLISKFRGSEETVEPEPQVAGVQIQKVVSQNEIKVPLKLSGQAKAKQSTVIRSLVQGTVQYILPVGSQVSAGTDLFRLANSSIEASYFSALSSLSNAQSSVSETEASTQSSAAQSQLALSQAQANLELIKQQLADAQVSGELQKRQALDAAYVAYDSGYATVDQAMRFLGGPNINDYAYKSVFTTNQELQTQALNQFTIAKISFSKLSLTPSNNIATDLNLLEEAIKQVKTLNNQTLTLLTYAVEGNGFSSVDIAAAKAQVQVFSSQLNAADSQVKSTRNAILNIDVQVSNSISSLTKQVEIASLQVSNAENAVGAQKTAAQLQKIGSSTQLSAANSQYAAAKFQYDNLSLGAPFTGSVISHKTALGSQVSPGQELIELGDINAIEIRVEISGAMAGAVKLGQAVAIDGKNVGRVSEIEPAASNATGKVGIKIEAANDNGEFLPGSIVEVEIELVFEAPGVVVVPLNTVEVGQNSQTVLVYEAGKAVRREVQLGQVYGSFVEVLSGLNPGDDLILNEGGIVEPGDNVVPKGN